MDDIDSQPVHLVLSSDSALVFFEWLCRLDNRPVVDFEDQSEQRVVWDLIADLETKVPVLSDKYSDLLTAARDRVRDATD